MFKKGDKVKIIKKDTLYGWADSLVVGNVYVIMDIDSTIDGVRLPVPTYYHSDGLWWIPPECVELVQKERKKYEQFLLFELV